MFSKILRCLINILIKNKSVVLAVSHYGNWEWGILGISLNAKQKMMGVYKKLNDSFFNDFMNKTRGRFGADLVEMKESLRHIISTKDQCKIIGLLADQSPVKNESNYWTTFLNQETSVYLGPEKIAEKMNYPVLFCSMKKVKRGRYEVLIEELCTNPEKTTKGEITSLYLHKIEEKIKRKPRVLALDTQKMETQKMKTAVVILNWNGKDWLEKFLPNVIQYSNDAEVIIADNNSSDDSIKFLEENYPNIRIIQNDGNYGYAKGYNLALKQIDAEYFVLLKF